MRQPHFCLQSAVSLLHEFTTLIVPEGPAGQKPAPLGMPK